MFEVCCTLVELGFVSVWLLDLMVLALVGFTLVLIKHV